MHPEFLEFLEFAKTLNRFTFIIHTNGSLRNVAYWHSLAKVLKNTDHRVMFSVDGLADTNHIYRQKTSWNKIIDNARSFIESGGNASWQYLIFPWNQHQVDEAKQLSIDLGFKEFMSRHDRSGVSKISLDSIAKKKENNDTGSHKTDIETINKNLSSLVNNEIECNNQNKKMFFIGFDSRLWPCCFLHNGMLSSDEGKREILKKRLFETYGSDKWNSCDLHDIETILSHPFYENDLVESWNSTEHGVNMNDRIFRCTEVCNKKTLETLPIGTAKVLYSKEKQ
jgi:MoaA/NifB/PqqE/SkfB family radical SAM enzyme